MRTISMNVYQIDELSEQAITKAHDKFCYEEIYPYHYENENSMQAIEKVCDMSIVDWEYDMYNYNFNLRINPELINMYGDELKQYLIDNFGDYMDMKKEVYGYFLDMDFFYHMKKLLPNINESTTYLDVMYNCMEDFFKGMVNDVENFYSREHFIDLALINEWEFYENGDML